MKQLLWAMILIISLVPWEVAQGNNKAAVFISDTIKPYFEAVSGLEAGLKGKRVDLKIVEIKNMTQSEFGETGKALLADGYTYWAAAGPEAMAKSYKCNLPQVSGRVYFMVLDPENVIEPSTVLSCGISLKISVFRQVEEIIGAFPQGLKPGLIFDPRYNVGFAEQALSGFHTFGIPLSLLKVNSRNQVAQVLAEGMKHLNMLWMIPDQTVISESIIQYIIKQAMERNIGIVGYNRYFVRQGAVAAFVIDYEKVGRQAAQILTDMMDGHACQMPEPAFEFTVNTELIRLLGMEPVPEDGGVK
ncbi:ABC transporter substrate binding protein [uncultured Desulfobacter sp.]|uniref:ABC transporter substrate binding protein n=1 Tax=uncultured Desulfobacter sp. TaxID=240139 RepID=UPI002AAB09A2|nr:ABC transporter substrate binding protein [uncultured Desulfobacter sp.]